MNRQCKAELDGRSASGSTMTRRGSTIVVAFRDLDRSATLLRKAAALAKARERGLELVHVIAMPYSRAVDRRVACTRQRKNYSRTARGASPACLRLPLCAVCKRVQP